MGSLGAVVGLQAASAVVPSLVAVLHPWSLSTSGGWIWSCPVEKVAQWGLRTVGPSHVGLTEELCIKVCTGQLWLNWESQSEGDIEPDRAC